METPFLINWVRQFRKGLLELAILTDINNRGMYAYEIEKTLCKSHGLLMGTGVIYRMLGRFASQRLVAITERKSPEGPNRKYYELTPTGQEVLRQMLVHWDAVKRQTEALSRNEGRQAPQPPAEKGARPDSRGRRMTARNTFHSRHMADGR